MGSCFLRDGCDTKGMQGYNGGSRGMYMPMHAQQQVYPQAHMGMQQWGCHTGGLRVLRHKDTRRRRRVGSTNLARSRACGRREPRLNCRRRPTLGFDARTLARAAARKLRCAPRCSQSPLLFVARAFFEREPARDGGRARIPRFGRHGRRVRAPGVSRVRPPGCELELCD